MRPHAPRLAREHYQELVGLFEERKQASDEDLNQDTATRRLRAVRRHQGGSVHHRRLESAVTGLLVAEFRHRDWAETCRPIPGMGTSHGHLALTVTTSVGYSGGWN